jgi:hypothetical protein
MTTSDLQRIERELGVKLPSDYTSLMAAYPFPSDSFAAESLLPNSADCILELAGARKSLPPNSFIIGNDGGEEVYFIDLTRHPSPVYVFELETGKAKEHAPHLDAYVHKCADAETEISRDQQHMARKKWWRFWR